MNRDQSRMVVEWGIKQFVVPALVFLFLFLAGNRFVVLLCNSVIDFDCPSSWPVSVVMARVPPWINYPNLLHFLTAMITFVAFYLFLILLKRLSFRIELVLLFGTMLILGSTLTHGWQFGFVRPVAGMGITQAEYYNNALDIEDPIQFISDFESIQASLHTHSRTHPPAAVLLYYFLNNLLRRPAFITIIIAVFSGIISGLFLYKILLIQFDRQISGFITFAFLLIPSIQIYYAASLDAVVASLLLGALAFFISDRSVKASLMAAIFVLLTSTLSFGFIFILPVLSAYEYWKYKSLVRSALIIGILIVFYILVFQFTGFNYSRSFLIASAIENPEGFRLFAEPFNYFATRIEDIAELLFFFGPYLSIFAFLGFRRAQGVNTLHVISLVGLGTLVIVFLSGAFRTGETARAAIFIYPYLMLPVASYLETETLSKRIVYIVPSLVFAQTMIMQMVADYFW